jgi:hypothetical protein
MKLWYNLLVEGLLESEEERRRNGTKSIRRNKESNAV